MQRTAVIIGATGLVGQALLLQLASLYQHVIIIARTQPKGLSENMHFYQLKDFNQLENFIQNLNFSDPVDAFSCLGTTKKQAGSEQMFYQIDFGFNYAFAKTCKHKGVKRFFLLSSMGANKDSRFFYSRVKGELEQAVLALDFVQLGIFRPSLLLGKHDNRRLENLAQSTFAWLKPAIPKKLPIYPIEAQRVAMAMALTANNWHIANVYRNNSQQSLANHRHQIFSNAEMLAMTRFSD
ncbi:nucleoside-diphosphate-sugar epimerase-like protein [Moraxella macacae 0408225]|uniref:Nucleoside-diphosphate-sugar epimerase-like protein n=1 Tax=Moraxella macacae 0408225 TaxID=1230338 RepID=L2F658_9GAMM|nr:NAD-dependent epimerase/dehydratase family protein [Moraxella macacae]ELA08539.1 nucleoside-diphosphate-sugar epimerase-like protein [Moraxella macacae 0408225]